MRRTWLPTLLLLALATSAYALRDDLEAALAGITVREIRAHLYFLSHDLLEGRAPASRGGELAAHYIASQFGRAGIEPVRGTHFQQVPLIGATVRPDRVVFETEARGRRVRARYPADVVLWPGVEDSAVAVTAELVFVGYGVRAPEHRWDDFKGRDVRGKILLVLVNDPPAPPHDPERFGGRAMTYYGRWTYKFEEAERQGAAGALIVHSPAGAGYDWQVVQTSWTGEQFSLPREPDRPPPLAVHGWITQDHARRILESGGLDLNELAARAARRDFRPVATGIRVRADAPARFRRLETSNVVGLVPGSHPELRNEVVIYTSHYDHLGIGPAIDGDSIYNGAYDNASGVSVLLEIAEAFARLDPAPDRSILFISTAAEEAGLLGASYYVQRPLFPLPRTVAAINIDGANLWGETDDVVATGAELSTLGDVVEGRTRGLGMRLTPDRAPEKGFFFRSDHFPFARAGIPAVNLEHGLEYRNRPAGWGLQTLERYQTLHYHRPSDRFDPDVDLDGAVQQARLAFLIGYDIARADSPPEWNQSSEYKAARDRMLQRAPTTGPPRTGRLQPRR